MTLASPRTVTLTQLHADPRYTHVAKDLADVGRLHRRIQSMFQQPRTAADILFRAEYGQTHTTLLVQSTVEPDTSLLTTGYTARTREIGPLLDTLTTGQPVRYRILANTTRATTRPDGRQHRIPLTGDDAAAWWQRRAETAGLDLHTASLTREDTLTGHRIPCDNGHQSRRHRLCHAASQFDGTALVQDPQTAREAIITGIGRARAYGCGLLSLAPIQED